MRLSQSECAAAGFRVGVPAPPPTSARCGCFSTLLKAGFLYTGVVSLWLWGAFHIRVCGLHEGRPHMGSKPAPQALALLSPGKKLGSAQGEQPLPVPRAALWGHPLPQPWSPATAGQPLPSCGALCNSHPECPEPALQATKSSKGKAKGLGSLFIFRHFYPALLRCWTNGTALAIKLLLFTLHHRLTGSCHPAPPLPAEQGGSRCSSRHLVSLWKQRKSHFLSSCRLKGHRQGATVCGK